MNTSTIEVSGPDAFEFLQGQLSNDLGRLDAEPEIRAAWCSPKGRVIWFGVIRKTSEGFALTAPEETADTIIKRLTMFRFRARVEFTIAADSTQTDPAELIRAGLPWIGAEQAEQFTPHMLNLDLLDAISFDKGCYTGQEIVARTHYRGATKRRMLRFESERPVKAGDKVSCDEREVGTVLNASGSDLLAVVPVKEADKTLRVSDALLRLLPLPYLDTSALDTGEVPT